MKWVYQLMLPVLFLLTVEAKAQVYAYRSFPDSNITWFGYLGCGVQSSSWTEGWTYNVTGDTIISGALYHCIGNSFSNIGLVREDSNRRVYFYNLGGFDTSSNELPLYDFSLSLNDTAYSGSKKFTVFDIDTPLYFGVYRRTLHLHDVYSNAYEADRWIEGVGSIQSPLGESRTYYPPCHWSVLCAAKQDSILLFERGNDAFSDGCTYLTSLEENLTRKYVDIYPNPATSSFSLQLSSAPNTPTYFQLYDAMGRQVRQEEINSISTTINRHQLPNGIYFWQLQQGNKILERGKLVME